MVPEDLKYTDTHEWVKTEDEIATVGITDYAQAELGEKVFVELPKVGASARRGEVFGSVESFKAVSDLVSPVTGEVVEVNEKVVNDPELISRSPYGDGWLVRVAMADPKQLDDLMTADRYRTMLDGRVS